MPANHPGEFLAGFLSSAKPRVKSPESLHCVESCLTCHLRSDSFFCALPEKCLEVFNQIKHTTEYPKNAVVFVEGQPPSGVFMLCQGQAKLLTTSRDGKTFVLRIAKAGDLLGLHATVTGKPYELTLKTMQDCQLNFVSRMDFLSFMRSHADVSMHVVEYLSREYQNVHALAVAIGLAHSISERLARLLLSASMESESINGANRIKLDLTHEEISQLVGTSRESISRTLSNFKKNRVAELKGSTLIIHNKAALEQFIGA